MHSRTIIPIQKIDLSRLSVRERLVDLRGEALSTSQVGWIVERAPDPNDTSRWVKHVIDGQTHIFAQPITFTPYASAKSCSARCRFCSETLSERQSGKSASVLRPGDNYFSQLENALSQLRGLPLAYSLSGLETSDDPDWMLAMLALLKVHAEKSQVGDRVMYSNAAGFAEPRIATKLIEALHGIELDWLEISRHHQDEVINQDIMRFRAYVDVQGQTRFERVLQDLCGALPVKLVCLVQRGGVTSAHDTLQYLNWVHSQGVKSVVFREFSSLDNRYVNNVTARYIEQHRITMTDLIADCLHTPEFSQRYEAQHVTDGYYFWNLTGRYRDMTMVFEASDYAQMHSRHDSGRVYKLVFHANGNLCAGWNPERHVLMRA